MKKRNYLILFVVVLSAFMLAGCSSTPSKSSDNQSDSSTATTDTSLTGADLLKSLNLTYPDSLKMTTTTTGSGMDSTITTVTKGENSRIEMDVAGSGKQIIIHNAQDGMTYQYTEGQTTGLAFKDTELTSATSDLGVAQDVPKITDLNVNYPENMVARMDTLNGEKVVYIEMTETDAQDGAVDIHMWVSTKYGVPLKYEIYSNGSLIMTSVVTDISTGASIADSEFTPPANVTFTDFSNLNLDDLTNLTNSFSN
jgi:outer membrane lipoprotein-sorting protein